MSWKLGLGPSTVLYAALFGAPALGQPAASGELLIVDDDGVQCPGALRTIQDAVARAPARATVLVCPGTYGKTVLIKGHEKDGLRLIGIGGEDEVVLAGDHTESHGFELVNVDFLLIRGFTVRDFGSKRTNASQFGWGSGIYLQNSNYGVIEANTVTQTDLAGIILSGSGHNVIRHNHVFGTDPTGFGCGIYLEGRKSVDNLVFQNYVHRQSGAGIHLGNAGPGNIILDNDASNNGHAGILHDGSIGTWIEGNRVSYNAGAWGVSPFGKGPSFGIRLVNSDKVNLFDNVARSNTAFDLSWDGAGEVVFTSNSCETATRAGVCGQ
jgi:parallel beta-helix repeat protein